MKKLLFAIPIFFIFSCESRPSETKSTETVSTHPQTMNDEEWVNFWNQFQLAVKNKDVETLKSFCYESSINPQLMDNLINGMFEIKFINETILNTSAKEATFNPKTYRQKALEKFPSLVSVECVEIIKNDTGAMSNYYFTKINGEFKLVYYLQTA